jgi:hypothetical protein
MSNGDFACGTALPSAVIGVIAHGVVVGCTARHSPQYLLTASLTSANMTTTAAARAIVMNHGGSAVSPEPEGGTFARGHTANDKSRTRIDSPFPKKLDWQKKTPDAFCLFSKVNIGVAGDEKACFPATLLPLRCACMQPALDTWR